MNGVTVKYDIFMEGKGLDRGGASRYRKFPSSPPDLGSGTINRCKPHQRVSTKWRPLLRVCKQGLLLSCC